MTDKMSGNKGEWSELYTFLKLLNEGRVYAANERVEKMYELFFPILKIIREEHAGEKLEYVINEDDVSVQADSVELLKVPRAELGEKADYLLKEISRHSNSFEIEEIAEYVNGIKVTKIKAPSSDTTDISMEIHDFHTGYKGVVGFSIKSEVGNAPTLLNAGETTNFVYKVTGISDNQMNEINSIDTASKIVDKMEQISRLGGTLTFFDVAHSGFRRNLIMIDSRLPEILGDLVLCHYQNNVKSLPELVEMLGKRDPLGFGETVVYSYKVKKFLCSCALGMKPAKKWDGIDEANGGYIIVKADGEILAYHIYNRNLFEEYLMKNTVLERASTTRHKYMELYKENGEMFIKLNLQIRFTK